MLLPRIGLPRCQTSERRGRTVLAFACLSGFCALMVACTTGGESNGVSSTPVPTAEQPSSTRTPVTVDATEAPPPDVSVPGLPCEEPPSSLAARKLSVWSVLVDEGRAALEESLLRFNRDQKAVVASIDFTGSQFEIMDRLRAGERPDLLVLGTDGLVNLFDSGAVTPMQRCIAATPDFDTSDLLPLALATYRRGDALVALPVAVSAPVLVYDRKTFRAAGLDPDTPPRTMAELDADLRQLVTSGAASVGLTYGEATWFITQWAAQCGHSLLPGENGRRVGVSSMKIDFDDPCLRDALQRLQAWAADGLVAQPTPPQTPYDDLLRLVAIDDKAGMAMHTSGSLSRVFETVQSSGFDAEVGVGPLPGPGVGALVGGSGAYITTGDPNLVWGAWSLARFLVEPAQQVLFGKVGYAPVRASTLERPDLAAAWQRYPGLEVAYRELSALSPTDALLAPVAGSQEHLFYRCDRAAEDVLRSTPVNVALAAAATDIDSMLESYRLARQAAP